MQCKRANAHQKDCHTDRNGDEPARSRFGRYDSGFWRTQKKPPRVIVAVIVSFLYNISFAVIFRLGFAHGLVGGVVHSYGEMLSVKIC